ncbi:hypothetical protein BaRGS_00039161 [Batillaria attramentaria]|uniref:SOCS box domain-containing protein n=1 Tax=Batillaria attramentaria TaxID=370345 RepID=A0ABD0J3W8_9CAEN
MQQNDWTAVSFMLECFTVSAILRRQAVDKVCAMARYRRYVRDNDFLSIIQHCDHTQLVTVLQAAVERNLSHTAYDILARLGQHGKPGALTENGRAILLAVMDMKKGRQKLVTECMKLGITTGESKDTNRCRLLCSYSVDILRKDSPFRRAVLDNNIVIVRMLYECGVCSNTDIQKLCKVFAVWEVQSDLFQTTFQKMSMFLKEKICTPRSLMSMCRLVISRHLGVGCTRQERVKQLPLLKSLRDYVVFPNNEGLAADDVTDDATPDGEVTAAALLDVQLKLAPMRKYLSDDYGGFESDCYDYDYYDYDNDYPGYDCYGYDSDGW